MATILRQALPIIPARPIQHDAFHLLATTTAPGETVTLRQIAAYAPTAVVWGDGAVTPIPKDTDTTPSHVYAAAGDYRITIPNARVLTKIDIRDNKVHGINTRDLRGCRKMHTFYLSSLSGSDIVVNSADMVGGGVSYQFYLYNCSNLTGILNSSDMTGWGISYEFLLYNCPNLTGTLNAANMVGWTVSYRFRISGCPNMTGILNSSDMTNWGISDEFLLYNCPNLTGTLNAANMVSWNLSYNFTVSGCPNITYFCSDPGDIVWTGIDIFRANGANASLATVNNTIQGFWNIRNSITYATPNLNLGGASNATPSGVYQSVCPPTSALEQVYNLANVQCAGDTHNPWTVTWNGGSAP